MGRSVGLRYADAVACATQNRTTGLAEGGLVSDIEKVDFVGLLSQRWFLNKLSDAGCLQFLIRQHVPQI
jgi:hypothetical protein